MDIELVYDSPLPQDYCGTCTKCIDACPTQAILPDKTIQGNHCISYYTIELKKMEGLPENASLQNWAFGCDICQDVCPWNRFSTATNELLFSPNQIVLNYSKKDWTELTEEIFNEIFKNSAVKRTKFAGLKRSIKFLNV